MDILKKVLLIKIISYILLCAFLFTNTAYSAQPIFTLRSHLISTGEGKDGELGERSAAYIFGNPPKFRMGSMELGDMKLLQALTLATQGKFDEAFIRTKGALLDEAYILNIDTAIFILSGLLAIYGPKTNKGKEVTTLLNIIKVHDKDVDQTVMKEKIQGHIVDSYLDEIRFLYERGYSLLQDNKAQEAWKLLNRAQSMLYELQSKYSFLKTDERIAPLRLDIEADLRMIQDGDELLLKDRLLQAVNPDTGEFLDIDLDFYEAHDGGKYHCNSQVLILDPEGRILTPVRTRRQRKKDISATAHLFKDESFEACALRAVKADTGLSSINKNSLIPLGPIIGEKKMGYQNYKDTRPYYYDEDGIFRSASQEKDNREYGRFFLCILTPEQVSEIQDTGNPLIQTLGLTFTSLSAYLESVVRQPEEFASTALQLFGHPNNINLVHSKILNGIESIFDHIKTHPDEIVELSYVETLYRSCRSTIERIENWEGSSWAAHLDSSDADFTDKCKAMALQDLENRYQELRTITVWRTLESHYRDKLILGWKDVYDIINVMNLLGNDAQSVQGRALLHTFLKKGVKIKRLSKSKFIFEYDGHRLKGLSIDNKGKLNITPAIRKGVDLIRRGAIAADMDLTTAFRNENIDQEMFYYINQILILGMLYGIVSGNEFKKQYRRSLRELIVQELCEAMVIYASGAGVKTGFDDQGELKPDNKYSRSFDKEQLEALDPVLDKLLIAWRSVMMGIINSGYVNEDGKINGSKTKQDAVKSIKKEFKDKDLIVYGIDIAGEIMKNIDDILDEIETLLTKSDLDDKEKKHHERLLAQLRLNSGEIQLLENDEHELRRKEAWPFIDTRPDIVGNGIIQKTLKPMVPSKGRELLRDISAKIIEQFNISNADYVPIKVTGGGSTSVDFTREDISKATAAEDLVVGEKLGPDDRDLVIAIDDEMEPGQVGFPFLTVPGITVISIEKTKNGKKRTYPKDVAEQIKAEWFWTGDHDLGYELEATKNIYIALIELYMQEMLNLCMDKKDVTPAIRRLKQELVSGKITDYINITNSPLAALKGSQKDI